MQVLAPGGHRHLHVRWTATASDRGDGSAVGPGPVGYTLLNPGTPAEPNIGKIDVLNLSYGDVLRIGTPGGGGYGDPLERDPPTSRATLAEGSSPVSMRLSTLASPWIIGLP